jgi:CHAT domain-containing protein
VIHFATHARLSGSPPMVRIQLADGELTVRDILKCKSSAELVVLSMCWSGVPRKWGREEFLGLAEAFLVAGALTVVATHWPIDDASAQFVVRDFYIKWLDGAPAVDALEKAVSYASSQQKWNHPHWWGAFFAVGRSVSFP